MINNQRTMCIVLSWKREKNIPEVIQGLRKQSCIDDILIFHNHPSSNKIDGCFNFFSKTNLGCVARHDMAYVFNEYKYFLFSDDDFAFVRDLSDRITDAVLRFGEKSVVGMVGLNLNLKNINKAYSTGKTFRCRNVTPTDIVKGRFHIMSKENLYILYNSGLDTELFRKHDDLRANIAIQKAHRVPSFLFPVHKNDFKELDDSWALNKMPDHFKTRNEMIKKGIEMGWKPLR